MYVWVCLRYESIYYLTIRLRARNPIKVIVDEGEDQT